MYVDQHPKRQVLYKKITAETDKSEYERYVNWRGARIKTKENTKEKDCAGKWQGCECPFTEDGSMHDRQGRESGQKLFFYNNVEAVINQNFKNVLRTFLRLRVDKERFYFAHL